MKEARLPYEFVKKFGEKGCAEVSTKIVESGVSHVVEKMSENSKKYLMKDGAVIDAIRQMDGSDMELPLKRLESLFLQAGDKRLSELSYMDIQEVLMDEEIPEAIQYNFLKYYKRRELPEGMRSLLLKNLEKYRFYVKIDMGQLTEDERGLLFLPLFSSQLLDSLWDIRDTWSYLQQPGVLPLMQMIHVLTNNTCMLKEAQFLQMAGNAEEIKELLEKVLAFWEEEQRQDFMRMWLNNASFLTDLKHLIRVLPDLDAGQKEKMLENRISYAAMTYRADLDGVPIDALSDRHVKILLYAIVTGKRHFLALVKEHSEEFLALSSWSLLLDEDIYRNYLNLNTLNEKNLRDGYALIFGRKDAKKYLNREIYTFEELKTLAPLQVSYLQLYGFLELERSDDRMRVLWVLVKRGCLSDAMEETALQKLAGRLSEKPLSSWMQEELGHIRDLKAKVSVKLLADWEDYQNYIPEVENERQVLYLIRNRKTVRNYDSFGQFQKKMLQEDAAWLWLKEMLPISDEFVERFEQRIREFVYEGEAEIVYQFCQGEENRLETVRRLVTAELMGEFEKLKYHEADLEREIAYPVDSSMEKIWRENLKRKDNKYEIWEEDRFIPMLQIGEVPMSTCLSYVNGIYKDCLLSCFDANKKVLYLAKEGKIVFRALLRLTKGSDTPKPVKTQKIEFVDLVKEAQKKEEEGKEELILFLERPYFSKISGEEEESAVALAYQVVQEKAKKLNARIVISTSYEKYESSKAFRSAEYYVYISASKNGKQYLDSLHGEASVSRSGSYGRNWFLMMEDKRGECAA